MTEAQRVAVLDAHPRIGVDAASLSLHSRREQGDAADAATLRELGELNDAYEKKFGFRFVVFVAGRTKQEILPMLRARLANTRDAELKTGLDEFLAISLDRLERPR
jgi:2-oxo-4-hydroxy-4-carboxy--5-ureidoimidazoline (OHCU) decarboxylase